MRLFHLLQLRLEGIGLRRHPALRPFSRDHLIGLFHAQRLMRLVDNCDLKQLDDTMTAFELSWETAISVHFADEDWLLGTLPLSTSNQQRLHDEHLELTALIKQSLKTPYLPPLCARVGVMLADHISWEEHDLFPEIESRLSASELETLEKKTAEIEKTRHRVL